MIIEFELRDQIARAMRGEVSLDDLYRWVVARSWNMHLDSEPAAVELAAEVEGLFFERSDGLIDDAALRRELSKVLSSLVIEVNTAPAVTRKRSTVSLSELITITMSSLVKNLPLEQGMARTNASRPLVLDLAV